MAKDRYEIDFSSDPTFNTVIGLSNTTFDINNVRSGHMATEDQISQLYADIVRNEKRRDECCRDIIIWEARVQVVRMNRYEFNSNYGLMGGGAVISTFEDNVSVGTARKGLAYTVKFPLSWSNSLYVPRSRWTSVNNSCGVLSQGFNTHYIAEYRIIEENTITLGDCQSTSTNFSRFWLSPTVINPSPNVNNNSNGHIINPDNNWGSFVHDVKDDGTVTVTDNRRNSNYNIIRFYTQWVLRRCANGDVIPDSE